VLALGTAAAYAQPVPAQRDAPPVGQDLVTLNFVDADIRAVVAAVSEITGRSFVVDPRVQGTVNIVSPRPVPRAMVMPIMLSALRGLGFAAVGSGQGYLNIVPEPDAKFYGAARAGGDAIVTEVFRLQHEAAAQAVTVLRPLVSPNNVVNAFPSANAVIVTDYASNVERIRRVLATIDQPAPGEITPLPLRYAAAVDVGQAVQRLLPEAAPGPTGAPPRLALTVDPRTNSLLVRADNPALVKRLRGLVDTLDVPTASSGNINVVYLRNADAQSVADTLRGMLSGQTQASARAAAPAAPPPPGAPPAPPPAGATATPGAGLPAASGALGPLAQVSVQAHVRTNSLIVIAPDAVYRSLRSVIEQLDSRPAQVYVEALIVELTSSKAAEFGVQWQILPNGNNTGTQGFAGTNFSASPGSNILGVSRDLTSVGQGLNVGLIRGRITIGGTEILNIAALARALETDAQANILSTPTLLTLDNEEAKIQVGQNVPIVTGSFTLAGTGSGAVNPFQTFERRDIGVTLKVRPQIAEGGTVRMQLYQEVSSIFNANNPTGIILNKRSLESQVLVDDGQVIVLGGLISDDTQTQTQGVPVLSRIPGLGALFRYDTRRREKVNLMIFLRPLVIRDASTAAGLTGNRYDLIRGVQGRTQPEDRLFLPQMRGAELPEQLPPLAPGQAPTPPRPARPPPVQTPAIETPP
jgi:general secretion pathway protein D